MKSEQLKKNSFLKVVEPLAFFQKTLCFHNFLGGIQVLRHQRGGWVGWPNDDF